MNAAAICDTARVFRIGDGGFVAKFPRQNPDVLQALETLTWTKNYVAFTTPDTVQLWDPMYPKDRSHVLHVGMNAFSIAFSPDWSRLAISNGAYQPASRRRERCDRK